MSELEQMKKRHGFVSFWLVFGIISNGITLFTSIGTYQKLTNLGYLGLELISRGVDISPFGEAIQPHVLILQIVSVVSCICMIISYIMLLNWKKSGFWMMAITAGVVAITNVVMMEFIKQDYAILGLTVNWNPIYQLIVTPISILILFAILQLKKYGVSCWRNLK